MSKPEVFPGWKIHPTGKRHLAQSEEEFARLGPGWYHSIEKATEAARALGFPWESQDGLFATETRWGQHGGVSRAKGHLYALHCVSVAGHWYAEGEILPPGEIFRRQQLFRAGDLDYVPNDAQPVRHEQTGRMFVDRAMRDAYAKRYDKCCLTGWFEWQSAAPAQSDHVPATPSSPGRGRPKGSGELAKLSWEAFLVALRQAGVKALEQHTEKGHPKSVAIAAAFKSDRRLLTEKLKENGHTWATIYPLIFGEK